MGFLIQYIRAKTNCDLFILNKEDLKHCLQYYPQVAEHIITVAKERYNLLKTHEQSTTAHPDITVEYYSTNPADQPNQNDGQETSKPSCLTHSFIINPESYIGLAVSAIGHFLVLFTSLILPYQV